MYKSIEQIKTLRAEKHDILKNVYQSSNPDDVYKKQSALGSMTINIFTDVANAIMPALQEDGASSKNQRYFSGKRSSFFQPVTSEDDTRHI